MSTVTKAARNSLLWLLTIIVALGGGIVYEALTQPRTPDQSPWLPRLGLDLAGGRIIILQAKTIDGTAVTTDSLKQSVEIIRRRVDASGVAEALITTENP
ncbi:MAG TPA: protein translocase subunit SecD, partial [Demequinaceae bacterium]